MLKVLPPQPCFHPPGLNQNSHLTGEESVCMLVSQLVFFATVSVPNRSVHVWDAVVFRGSEKKVVVAFKAQR